VEKESAEKLASFEGHDSASVLTGVVLVVESDLAFVE
jgi:hypothetical protein